MSETFFDLEVASDAVVPGTAAASSATLVAQYDNFDIGMVVLASDTGNVYMKTLRTSYAGGGRIKQLTTGSGGGGSPGVDGTFPNIASAVAVGDLVYLVSDGTIAQTDADTDATMPGFGFVIQLNSTTSSVVRMLGEVTLTGPLVAGTAYYASGTAGGITATKPTAPSITQFVGRAKSTTVLEAFANMQSAVGLFIADNAQNTSYSTVSELTLLHTTSGAPGAGVGSAVAFKTEAQAGVDVLAGQVGAKFTSVTAGVEVGVAELLGANSGAINLAGLHVTGVTGTIINGVNITPTVSTGSPVISPFLGGPTPDTNVSLKIRGAGTGGVNIRDSLDTTTILGVQNVTGAILGIAVESSANTTGGAQIINTVAGSFRYLTTDGTGFIISNNHVLSATSQVFLTFRRVDTTLLRVSALAAAGQFTVTGNAAPAANTDISFLVINAAV